MRIRKISNVSDAIKNQQNVGSVQHHSQACKRSGQHPGWLFVKVSWGRKLSPSHLRRCWRSLSRGYCYVHGNNSTSSPTFQPPSQPRHYFNSYLAPHPNSSSPPCRYRNHKYHSNTSSSESATYITLSWSGNTRPIHPSTSRSLRVDIRSSPHSGRQSSLSLTRFLKCLPDFGV